jgi:hypothetical protein
MYESDYLIFGLAGRAILAGDNPYSIRNSFYPPATSMFFAFLALVPVQVSYVIWIALNLGLLLVVLKKNRTIYQAMAWLAYTPVLFTLISGQLDLMLYSGLVFKVTEHAYVWIGVPFPTE